MERDLLGVTARSLGGRMFVALWGGLALVDIAGRAIDGLLAGLLVVGLVAACEVRQPPLAAASIAATGWLVIDGFVLHRYGELDFGAASWSVLAGVLLVGAGVAVGTARSAAHR
jgi:hypothetical protein